MWAAPKCALIWRTAFTQRDNAMILVTGGTGHTGSRLALHFAERGEDVRVLTRTPDKARRLLGDRVPALFGDLADPASVASSLASCTAVLALTHIRFAPKVIELCRAAGVRRAIFTSSTRRFTNFPEETARQVIAGEEAVSSSGLDWTIIRPSMIYGGPQDNNIEHLVRSLRRWPVHPLPGGGRMRWQPVFTWDVIAAIESAMERRISIGKAYTVAGPESISYADMVRTILRRLNRRALLVPLPLGALKVLVRFYGRLSRHPRIRIDQILRLEEDKVFDISEARNELGSAPSRSTRGFAASWPAPPDHFHTPPI